MADEVHNAPTALTTNTFTRTGYDFTGWNTAATGSGTAYADGATYSFAADVTLYAQWTPVDSTAPTSVVTLDPVSPNGSNGWYRSPVGVTVTASEVDDTVIATNCGLDPVTAPTSFGDIPSGCAYSTKTSVSTAGSHTVYAASQDSHNNQETPVSASFKIDATRPTVQLTDCPSSPVALGSSVTAHWTASDTGSGLASASSGSISLPTGSTGAQSVNAPTATD